MVSESKDYFLKSKIFFLKSTLEDKKIMKNTLHVKSYKSHGNSFFIYLYHNNLNILYWKICFSIYCWESSISESSAERSKVNIDLGTFS